MPIKIIVLQVLIALILHISAIAQFGAASTIHYLGGSDIPFNLEIGDFNNDNVDDFVSNGFGVLYWGINDGYGSFLKVNEIPFQGRIQDLIIIDYNNDNYDDIVYIKTPSDPGVDPSSLQILVNNKNGNFYGPHTLTDGFYDPSALETADFNKDGQFDILIGLKYGFPKIVINNGSNNEWGSYDAYTEGWSYSAQNRIVDIDNDGQLDIISLGGDRLAINGVDVENINYSVSDALEVSDLNADGYKDIIIGSPKLILKNNQGKTFEPVPLPNNCDLFSAIELFDMDQDGDEDIISVCWFYSSNGGYYENLGNFNFQYNFFSLPSVTSDEYLKLSDIDNDGRKDIILTNSGSHRVSYYSNDIVQFEGITASFDSKNKGCLYEPIEFYQTSQGLQVESWEWDFGDGNSSQEQNPIHIYKKAGMYEVNLIVTNSQGYSDEVIKTVEIIPNPYSPDIVAPFCSSYSSGNVNIELDSLYKYDWYYSITSTTPFYSGHSFDKRMSDNSSYYVEMIDSVGCKSSSKFKVTARQSDIPNIPRFHDGNKSNRGPNLFHLKPSIDEITTTVNWYNNLDDSIPFKQGVEIYEFADAKRRLFFKAISEVGCESDFNMVDLYILNKSYPSPKFIRADVLNATNWSEGIEITKGKDGSYYVIGVSKGKLKVGTFEIHQEDLYRFIIKYDANDNAVDLRILASSDKFLNYRDKLFVNSDGSLYYINMFEDGSVTIADSTFSLAKRSMVISKINNDFKTSWIRSVGSSSSRFSTHFDGMQLLIEIPYTAPIQIGGNTYNSKTGLLLRIDGNGNFENVIIPPVGIDNLAVNSFQDIATVLTTYNQSITIGDSTFNRLSNERTQKLLCIFNDSGSIKFVKKLVFDLDAINNIEDIQFDQNDDLIMMGEGKYLSVLKLNSDYDLIWDNYYEREGQVEAGELKISDNNEVFFNGKFYSSINIGGISVNHTIPKFDYNFLAKINLDGQTIWARSAEFATLSSFFIDDREQLIFTGSFKDQIKLDDLEFNSATQSTTYINYNIVTSKLGWDNTAQYNYLQLCDGSVQFQNTSSYNNYNEIQSIFWDFGDGNTSNSFDPIHKYADKGSYEVSLSVKNTSNELFTISKTVNVSDKMNIGRPTIITEGLLCEDQDLVLRLDIPSEFYEWSNGKTTESIRITEPGFYRVRAANALNCWSDYSDTLEILRSKNPSKPIIQGNNETYICDGDTLDLLAPSGYQRYEWNNHSTSQLNRVSAEGSYKVKVYDGCWSLYSDELKIDLYESPDPPVINPSSDTDICYGDSILINAIEDHFSYYWSNGDKSKSIVVDSPGTYSLIVSNEYGCKSSKSREIGVLVHEIPETPKIYSNVGFSICEGESMELSTDSGEGYLWSNNSNDSRISVSSGGEYYVSVFDINGCSSISDTVSISILPLPEALIIKVSKDSLKASLGTEYKWFLNGDTLHNSNQYIYVEDFGIYQVEVKNEYGCSNLSEKLEIEVVSGLKNQFQNDYYLFPNPVLGDHLSINSTIKYRGFEIYNSSGVLVQIGDLITNQINVSRLPSSAYYLKLFDDQESVILRFIKK